jgi:hypothetical protein
VTAVALSWTENGRARATAIRPDAEQLIGREPGAAVALTDATVSRRHALVSERGGHYVIENLSATNPTRVNEAPLERDVELSDGDRIKAGSVLLFFHDLASHDALQGPVCSYCKRENKSTDKDCWYCGTSLVNALTLLRERRPVSCRVLTSTGKWRDLYAEQYVALTDDERFEPQPFRDAAPATAAVATRGGEVRLRLADDEADVRVNGKPATADQQLQTGDDISVGEDRFTVVVRS